MKKKVCFVIQRYGLEVNGGAELQCRQLAEHMKELCDIEIITTKAKDYITWKNEYTSEEEIINGVKVYRYPVEHERDISEFGKINETFHERIGNLEKEKEWIEAQGPYSPKLIQAIREKKDDYNVFVFFTYLYYTTIQGIREVFDKAILIPEAHDEPYIHMSVLSDVFQKTSALLYNTETEKKMVETFHDNGNVRSAIGGAGIEINTHIDVVSFKKKYKLNNYLVYVGRIDNGKLCPALLKYFIKYKNDNKNDIKLVLIGKACIKIPKHSDIISLGFVSDEDKFNAIAGSLALVLPSQFESLSMVVLEAMKLRVPVIVNGDCEVVKAHCVKSNGGLYYENYMEFAASINYLMSHLEARTIMGNNGNKYVDENYSWPVIIERLNKLVEYVSFKN